MRIKRVYWHGYGHVARGICGRYLCGYVVGIFARYVWTYPRSAMLPNVQTCVFDRCKDVHVVMYMSIRAEI